MAMPTSAVALIAEAAADGHALVAIAAMLNGRGISTPSGRHGTAWFPATVSRVAQAHGIKVSYSPHKIAAAKLRATQSAEAQATAVELVDALKPGPETLSFTAEALKRACSG